MQDLKPGKRLLGAWAVLGGSLVLALAVYFGFPGSASVDTLGAWTARWTSIGLNLLGSSTRVNGSILSSDSFAVSIVAECTTVGPILRLSGQRDWVC